MVQDLDCVTNLQTITFNPLLCRFYRVWGGIVVLSSDRVCQSVWVFSANLISKFLKGSIFSNSIGDLSLFSYLKSIPVAMRMFHVIKYCFVSAVQCFNQVSPTVIMSSSKALSFEERSAIQPKN